MQILLYIGIFAGIVLYGSKLYITSLALSPFPRFHDWIQRTSLALVAMDIIFGFMGMHVIMIAGGSVIAMLTMISFGACSVIYIICITLKQKFKRRRLANV